MRIVFVRHGHPNYEKDCLTPLGRLHGEAAAERLAEEGMSRIFSSTCGRALETAGFLAERLHLEVERCDFMREISWGSTDGSPLPFGGHPWDTADDMAARGESRLDPDWAVKPPFAGNRLTLCADRIADETDRWLAALGYVREGLYYRQTKAASLTVAAFGHGGASAAILSHLFNLPFPFVCSAMGPHYTGVTIVDFGDREGALVHPRFEILSDARHIQGIEADNLYGN